MSEPRPGNDAPAAPRVASIDVYRGFVMFLMMAEVLHLGQMARNIPRSSFWEFLAFHQDHVAWRGCSLHDLIQPSFTFLVGVALPFSLANRLGRGQGLLVMTFHAAWRALVLIFLGIFLRSLGGQQTNFTFEDTLTQIGLGYFFLFLIALARPLWQWILLAALLVGTWAAFAVYPLPGPSFDYAAVGVPADWSHHQTGFAAHWNKNSNLAWAFDTWFLNLFPRVQAFTHNRGGYATLSFIPTLATMLLGLFAGRWLRDQAFPLTKIARLALAGAAAFAAGIALDQTGVCPSVKRIWTPAWVLYSGAWCFWFLAAFYLVLDLGDITAWAYPLRVIGANSIAAYCMDKLFGKFILESFKTHFGKDVFKYFDARYEPLVSGAAVLLVLWLILFWLYRRRIYVRI